MINIVQDSTAHFFIKTLEALKAKPTNWYGLYFSMSKLLQHHDLVSNLEGMVDKIEVATARRDLFVQEAQDSLKDIAEGTICAFKDLDVFILIKTDTPEEKKQLNAAFKALAAKLPEDFSDMDLVANQFRSYMKLADQKLLSVRRFESYDVMTDTHKTQSIAVRRKRREEPLVMVVEDDRFTAHYVSTILSTDFELVISKDGEEALQDYIENAPDIVFLDIHLPGMSGHEVLQAIQAVDPEAYVVMLSADTMRENIMTAKQMGAASFVKKPFTKERLIDVVKTSPYVRAITRSDSSSSEQLLH